MKHNDAVFHAISSEHSAKIITLLIIILTAKEILLTGSGTTIRQDTNHTKHIIGSENYTSNKRRTIHSEIDATAIDKYYN
jgi:hypothetical protein